MTLKEYIEKEKKGAIHYDIIEFDVMDDLKTKQKKKMYQFNILCSYPIDSGHIDIVRLDFDISTDDLDYGIFQCEEYLKSLSFPNDKYKHVTDYLYKECLSTSGNNYFHCLKK